jgi:ribosomal protein S6
MTDSNNESMSETAMKVYEVGYLILPSVPEEQIPDKASQIRDVILKANGSVISEETPKLRDLAYEMVKNVSNSGNASFQTGYFGWIKFEEGPEAATTLKTAMDGMESVLRFIIIKTVREDTFVTKTSVDDEGENDDTPDLVSDTATSKVKNEEIDKSIDALVSEK